MMRFKKNLKWKLKDKLEYMAFVLRMKIRSRRLKALRKRSKKNKKMSTGYPSILLKDSERPTFRTIRNMLDRTCKIQICMHEDLSYEDYKWIKDVPSIYDDRKVFGIGLVESYIDGPGGITEGRYAYAIEVVLL